MPIIDDRARGFTNMLETAAPERAEADTPGWTDLFAAGFRLDNDVVNAVELMSRPAFKTDLNYNAADDILQYDRENGTDFWDNYRDNFAGTGSQEQTRYIMSQIQQENRDRQTLARGGFAGMVASVGAGLLSPTNFIPLVGPMSRAKSAWQFAREAAMIGGAVGAGQEAIFQANQETRPWSESAVGIAGQTVLSGILGGAIGHLTKRELADTVKALNESTVIPTPVRPGSVNAAAAPVLENAGPLARGGQTVQGAIDKTVIARNPVSYNVMTETASGIDANGNLVSAPSEVARYTTTQLGDGGFRFQGNEAGVPTARGGTLENLIQTHYNVFPDIIKHLDEGFLEYRLGSQSPSLGGVRTMLQDLSGQTGGKMTKKEYSAAIVQALRNGDQHEIPQVAATAAHIRETMFNPLLREAQAAGIIEGEIDLKGDLSWVLRDYNRDEIRRNTQTFINTLADHFEQKLTDEFAQAVTKLKESKARTQELAEDLQRPADEIARLKEEFIKRQEQLEEGANAEHLNALEDTVANLRAQARAIGKDRSAAAQAQKKQLLADARDMEKAAGEPLVQLKKARGDVARRLRNFNRSYAVLEERQAAKLSRLERTEELQMNSLRRAARVGQKFLREMDKMSDAKFEAELTKLKNSFEDAAGIYDRGVERAAQIRRTLDTDAIEAAETLQEARADRLTNIANKIDEVESFDRQAARDAINEMQEAALQRIQKLNAKRALRGKKLEDAAKALDPEQVKTRIEALQAKQAARELDFMDNWRTRGADDIDIDAGKAVFRQFSREMATAAKDRIMGTFVRLPTVAKDPSLRGSEISRVLNVPSNVISQFLNNDVESLMRQTLRTLAPDIEIAKRFGDVNATDILGDPAKGQGGRLAEEMNSRIEAVRKWGDDQIAKGKNKEKIEKEVAKKTDEINGIYANYRRNIEAMIGRLRHTWGLPQDPEAMGYRMGKVLLNLNTVRLMGGVLISSIPDIARPIMRYGLKRTMRDGFVPLITNFKQMKMTMQEVKWLAGGLDATMQSRASAIFDLLDDVGRGSKFEQVLEGASRRVGLVGLFDKWTSTMKEFSGAVAHAKFMDSIDSVVNGKASRESIRFLAENGIDEDMAQKIWGEMVKAGGADKVDGRWWPNTEQWDPSVRQTYSQAIIREVNNSIITPGIDKPLWMDQSLGGRLLGQFRSFAFASTSRVVISGMQQRDMALVNAVWISLAFGALGYYTYAMAAGGKTREEMLNAGLDKWADEAIQRSGLLGIFGEVQRIAEQIPATQRFATFSGTRSTRRGGDNLVQAIAGPSLDVLTTSANVLANIHDPTQSTVHQTRTLLPGQNIFYLRQLFDLMEQAAPVDER